ncbi:hypothetical protein DSO57_1000322, partial [Entomophthora muscae]
MESPVIHKPMPASSPNLPTGHTGKLFRIVYITLTGNASNTFFESWICVRIDNFLSLETWGQDQDLNPDPASLQAASPKDQQDNHLCFPGT